MTISSNIKRGRPALPVSAKCGTTTGYSQGCRCDACRAAWAAYQRDYSARPDVVNRRAIKALQATPEGRAALLDAQARTIEHETDEARERWVRDTLL